MFHIKLLYIGNIEDDALQFLWKGIKGKTNVFQTYSLPSDSV